MEPKGDVERVRVRVRGQVQGVGFRPHVHALATRSGYTGWVLNDGAGVLLEAQGAGAGGFADMLAASPPPLARIDSLETERRAAVAGEEGFVIRASDRDGVVATGITPDAAVCPDCLRELFDPTDRRHRYPFLNCTHCGPRLTITRRVPYDRPFTSMAAFPMCADCAREYHDPTDRRFHAQPTACPACGPRLSHEIADVLAWLREGRIVAIKGLGGFHLACDATRGEAVARLRAVKQRDGKPFAVMVAGTASAERLVWLDEDERGALEGVARPIVVARRRSDLADAPVPAPEIAPGLAWLGVMLPHTPIQYLLFHEAEGRPDGVEWLDHPCDLALVMTSANPGGEPLVTDNAEAVARLSGIADVIVDHDREIIVRIDDSVMRKGAGAMRFLRRARGFTPAPIRLSRAGPTVLALGGHLKNALCVTRGDEAFPSQHVGDLDNGATIAFLEETARHLLDVLAVRPSLVAHDAHPDFASTRLARAFADEFGVPAVPVHHHHAHVAAVMAEHRLDGPVIGLALDGFGLGADGGAWGGEMLLVDGARCERLGHLAPLAQPGGDVAARQPWRMAAAALVRMGRGDEVARRFGDLGPAEGVRRMIETGFNAPSTSSCGRWFDAACGLLGVRPVAGFEGEAPMTLESLVVAPRVVERGWRLDDGILDLLPLLERLCDSTAPVEGRAAEGADLFHGTLAAALIDWTIPVLRERGMDRVVLSGGCLMNAVLSGLLVEGFAAVGVTAWQACRVPANDGGLCLGQAWVAARSREPSRKGGAR